MKLFLEDKSVFLASNSIIRQASVRGLGMTHMKLQKLIYFVYKKYLEDNGQTIFSNSFEAWQHGPVIREIYNAYRVYGGNRIDNIYAITEKDKAPRVIAHHHSDFYEALNFVLDKYGDADGWDLRGLTHMPNTAWTKAYEEDGRNLDLDEILEEEWNELWMISA